MESPYLILDAFILFYGFSGLQTCWKMFRSKGLVQSRMIVPGDHALTDCRDAGGYYQYIFPRLLAFSLVITITGILDLLLALFPAFLPPQIINITIPVFLLSLVLFGFSVSSAMKRFW